MSKFLIVGLGNIGAQYVHTRHNIGFDVLDAFVQAHTGFFQSERLADVAVFRHKGKGFICIKPTTYMNNSGRAFRYWMDKEKISLENTLTIVDELALPISKLRLRPGGSSGGHNGLSDIEATIGTNEYPRLRFGIGNDFPKGKQVEYVLGRWREDEEPIVNQKIAKCVEAIESFAVTGLQRTMNMINNLVFEN